jgi:hypothetical protein
MCLVGRRPSKITEHERLISHSIPYSYGRINRGEATGAISQAVRWRFMPPYRQAPCSPRVWLRLRCFLLSATAEPVLRHLVLLLHSSLNQFRDLQEELRCPASNQIRFQLKLSHTAYPTRRTQNSYSATLRAYGSEPCREQTFFRRGPLFRSTAAE